MGTSRERALFVSIWRSNSLPLSLCTGRYLVVRCRGLRGMQSYLDTVGDMPSTAYTMGQFCAPWHRYPRLAVYKYLVLPPACRAVVTAGPGAARATGLHRAVAEPAGVRAGGSSFPFPYDGPSQPVDRFHLHCIVRVSASAGINNEICRHLESLTQSS